MKMGLGLGLTKNKKGGSSGPTIATSPVISGDATGEGNTLTLTTAPVWTGATSSSYVWQRNGVDIVGSTNSTTVVVQAGENVGAYRVKATGTNAEGSTIAYSNSLNGIAAPTSAGALADQSFTDDTGTQTYDVSGDFTGVDLTYSLPTTVSGVTINSSTGVVSFDTNALAVQSGTSIVARATNNAGTADSGFSLAIIASTATPISDQDVVLGTSSTVDLDGPFSDYSGDPQTLTYSITAGTPPVGMAISGYQLTGTPLNEAQRSSITVQATDGGSYTQTDTFDLGCTYKSGIPAPNFDNFCIDVTAAIASGLDSDVTAANTATLWSAIETALMDGGSAGSPKIHRVTYTGADAPTDYVGAASYSGTPSGYSWVIVDGQGTTWGWADIQYHGVILHDFTFVGRSSDRRPIHVATSGTQVDKCKVGFWWGDSFDELTTDIVGNGPMEICLTGCHIAGGGNGVAMQSGKCTVHDCLFTHITGDIVRFFHASPTGYSIRLTGNVSAMSQRVNPGAHPDVLQTGGAPTTTAQMYENIWIYDTPTATPTGYRFGNENYASDGTVSMDARSNVWAGTGFNIGGALVGSTGYTGSFTLTDHVSIPAPGFGAKDDSFAIGAGALVTTTVTDATVFHPASTGVTYAGTIVRYNGEDATETESTFPSITGAVDTFTNHGGQPSITTYVPDLFAAGYNIREWRNAVSTKLAPSGGWGSVHMDPASYGTTTHWAAPGTYTAPTLSGVSASGTTLTVTASETGGRLWAFTSGNSSAPNFLLLRNGVEPDGTHNADPVADVDVFDVTATGSQNYTLSQSSSGKYVHVAYEADDGAYSTVSTATGADVTAPTLSSPTAAANGGTGATSLGVTTDEGNGTLYWAIYPTASTPTAADVVAGTGATVSGSQAVSATGVQSVSNQTGLTSETAYKAHYVHDDAAANRSNLSTSAEFTTADVTSPALTSPTAAANGSTGATSLGVTTDEGSGTLYWGIYPTASTPSAADVVAGTGATVNGSQAVSTSGVQSVSNQTGLTASTAYKAHYVHDDASANRSNLSTSAEFTTTAASSLTYLGTVGTASAAGDTTYGFTGGVNGNRVVAIILEATTNTVNSVTIGGVTATQRITDTIDGRLHIYDAVLTSSGSFDVVVNTSGTFADHFATCYDVGSKTYQTYVEDSYTGATPATLALSTNTTASDWLVGAVLGGVNTTVTAGTGWDTVETVTTSRNVTAYACSNVAAGGTPETMEINYTTAWEYSLVLAGVYR